MATRIFTKPGSLDQKLASLTVDNMPVHVNNEGRSEKAAQDATKTFSEQEKSPLSANSSIGSRPGITFAAQDKLPSLPIPDLESTCKKYLMSLKPLQTPKEHHDSEVAAREFLKSDGPDLQEKLKKYASGKANYIEQFCMYSLRAHKLSN